MDNELLLPLDERGRTVAANIPVVLGCSHACTFCIIPSRRGAERSRPAAEVIAEVRSLVAQGVRFSVCMFTVKTIERETHAPVALNPQALREDAALKDRRING